MKCPKCDEGTIVRIRFRENGNLAFLCDFCDSLWLDGEDINFNTGHTLHAYTHGDQMEYIVEDIEEKDQEHQPAKYSHK